MTYTDKAGTTWRVDSLPTSRDLEMSSADHRSGVTILDGKLFTSGQSVPIDVVWFAVKLYRDGADLGEAKP